jgi:hypothetical protein
MRAFLTLTSLAIAACYALEEGRHQSWTFQTQHAASEVNRRAVAQLARDGYQVLHADDRLIEAEKTREPGSFDVLRVIVEASASDGTRVRVQAVTEASSGGARGEVRFVSTTALADGRSLADALMTGSVPPPAS